jgi:hypothetical protein
MSKFEESVVLPSRGFFNEGAIPSGEIVLKMMGTAEEKLLSTSRLNADQVITKLLEMSIVSPKIDNRDLILQDRVYLLIRLRQLTFGNMYGFKMTCPSCGITSRFDYNLSDLPIIYAEGNMDGTLEATLPISEQTVYLRLPRGRDEEFISREVKRLNTKGVGDGSDLSYLLRISRYIHHTDDIEESDWIGKQRFVQELKAPDLLTLKQSVEDIDIGVDLDIVLTCNSCGYDIETSLPFGEEFFRPKLGGRNR